MKCTYLAGVGMVLCAASVSWGVSTAAPPFWKDPVPLPGAPAVSGTVSCREQIALPGMATVQVELIDISRKDSHAPPIGEDTIWVAGVRLPVSFRIAYDPSRIDPRHVYVVQAKIVEGEKLLFISKPYYVLTQGASSIAGIIVTPVR